MRSEELRVDAAKIKDATECLKQSFELILAGRLREAVEEMQAQIAEHPDYPLLNFELGITLFDLGEYKAACKAFKKELEITPILRDAAWELGSAYSRLDLVNQSIKAYERALDIDPCCVQALYGLGNAHRRRQDYHEAIEYYRDAIFLHPQLDRSALKASDQRARALAAAIHLNLGVMWMLIGRAEEAKESLENAQEIDPEGPLAKVAAYHLHVLSEAGEQLDSIVWESIELPPERLNYESNSS